MSRRVLIAPDSLKGGPPARAVADALAEGWRRRRSADQVTCLPMADGGEGTIEAIADAMPGAERSDVPRVHGPDGRLVHGSYLRLPDGTAVVELATASGLPLMPRLDPMGATTYGTGEVIRAAVAAGAERLVLAVGGSATTDGGAGIMTALGARFLDARGEELPLGGGSLTRLRRVDTESLLPPPDGGVDVLVDVRNPLVGPRGAAHTYGEQKGATARERTQLDAGLAALAAQLGVDPATPGFGAAGGVPAALAALWGARLRPGAATIGELVGLPAAVEDADVVVTAEGTFDSTSLDGKVVGHVLAAAKATATPALLVAGQVRGRPPDHVLRHVGLSELAGGVAASMARPTVFLALAGEELAGLSVGEGAPRHAVLPATC